jgi:hypothetical protein
MIESKSIYLHIICYKCHDISLPNVSQIINRDIECQKVQNGLNGGEMDEIYGIVKVCLEKSIFTALNL